MFLLMLKKRNAMNCQSNKYKQETEVKKKRKKKKSEFSPTNPDDTLPHSTDFINITTAMKFAPVHMQEMNWQQPLGKNISYKGCNSNILYAYLRIRCPTCLISKTKIKQGKKKDKLQLHLLPEEIE